MANLKQSLLHFGRSVLPDRVKGWLYKLSVSPTQQGSMFYHINNLKKLGYKPSLVVDVGAFRGEWTLNVLPIFPDSTFIMIEPQQDKVELLKQVAASKTNVHFIQTLVGAEQKESVLFYEMESGSSIYEEQTSHPRGTKGYSMTTLDHVLKDWFPTEEIFLKMDVQGAELDVLNGAEKILKNCNFILLEASLLNYNRGAPLVADVVNFLKDKGFVLFDCCEMRRRRDGVLLQIDLIFSRMESKIRRQVDYGPSWTTG